MSFRYRRCLHQHGATIHAAAHRSVSSHYFVSMGLDVVQCQIYVGYYFFFVYFFHNSSLNCSELKTTQTKGIFGYQRPHDVLLYVTLLVWPCSSFCTVLWMICSALTNININRSHYYPTAPRRAVVWIFISSVY